MELDVIHAKLLKLSVILNDGIDLYEELNKSDHFEINSYKITYALNFYYTRWLKNIELWFDIEYQEIKIYELLYCNMKLFDVILKYFRDAMNLHPLDGLLRGYFNKISTVSAEISDELLDSIEDHQKKLYKNNTIYPLK